MTNVAPVPTKVSERIAELELRYTQNDELSSFNILHLYPEDLAYPNGFYDSRWFRLVGFNTELNQRRELGAHDGVRFMEGVRVEIARVFADGSTLIRFASPVRVEGYQEAVIRPGSPA
jgi:hypothetical protein